MSRKVTASVVRVPWHTAHGGYDRLLDYLPEVDSISAPTRPVGRTVARIGWRLARPWHPSTFYPAEHFATDFKVLASRRPVHVLYGEEQFWFSRHRLAPTAVTYHQPAASLAKLQLSATWARLSSGAARVIAVAPEQCAFFRRFLPEDRIHLVPHGIDTDAFRPCAAPNAHRPALVLTVGWWLRDWSVLDAVHERLHRRYGSDIRMAVVTRRASARHWHPAVRVMEGVSESVLTSLYATAAVVLLPLVDATANNALLEALASGTPVVATDVSGIRYYAGSGPAVTLTPPGDPYSAAMAVENLLSEIGTSRHKERSVSARDRAQDFAWPRIAYQIRHVYRLLAEER